MAESYIYGRRPWALLSPNGSYHKLQGPNFVVGRDENVHLMLKSRSVDREHAIITAQPDQELYHIYDLESLNGTFVNEKRVQKAVLALRDTIRFGYDMNTFRVDLLPCQDFELKVFHNNNNSQRGMMPHDYQQDINDNPVLLTSNKGCKKSNEASIDSSGQVMSRLCQNCGSKTAEGDRLKTIVKGSRLYGQPSWWGWESSDDEFYTYPNCATVVTQAGTLAISPQHCSWLQQRVQRNKSKLEHSLDQGSTMGTSNQILAETSETSKEHLKESSKLSVYPQLGSSSSEELQQLAKPVYSVPAFRAWETVPPGRFGEGLEESYVDGNDGLLRTSFSYHIPTLPEFGEIPEKPVSEKSNKTARRKSSEKPLISDMASCCSYVSEASKCNNDKGQPTFDYTGHVFGLTEVNMNKKQVRQDEHWFKDLGIRVGKPKTSPVKVKTTGPKPTTPRFVTETNRSGRIHSSASTASSESMTPPTTSTRGLARASSSVPSDSESRESEARNVFTSTSDDSDEGRSTSTDDKLNSIEKHKKKLGSSLREKEEFSDKTHRPSSASSSLPRGNKTAMLRALNSREAVKNTGTPSVSRLHTNKKPRHRHSTPAAVLNKDNSPVGFNSSLRIWSPSIKKSPKATSPSRRTRRPLSCGSTPRSSRMSPRLSSDHYETQVAVDAIFESSTEETYSLPNELKMDRNDAKNKTFVLDEKTDQSGNSSQVLKTQSPGAKNKDTPYNSRELTIETLRSSKFVEGEVPNPLTLFADDRPIARSSQPPISAWMSLPDDGRSPSPESLLSIPTASSPSPPSTPRSSARNLFQDRLNCCSAPPHSRRQWDVTDKPVEDLMLSSVHAFTVELRLASESVLSKARNLYESVSDENTNSSKGDGLHSSGKQKNHSTMPEWKSSHAELAGVFRNLRRVEFNLRTMDQALSFLCSKSEKETCKGQGRPSVPQRLGQNPQSWKDFKVRARKSSWAEENRSKFPTGLPSDDEEVTSP